LHYPFANPIMSALPFWIRSIQCVYKIYECSKKGTPWKNHALNLGKYCSALCLVISSVLQVTFDDPDAPYWTPLRFNWLAWILIKSIYCTVWDVRMDWGLWRRPKSAKPTALANSVFSFSPSRIGPSKWSFDHFPSPRTSTEFPPSPRLSTEFSKPLLSTTPESVFPWRLRARRKFGSWFYYWAIFSNLVMRLTWSMTITAWSFFPDLPPNYSDVFAFFEILRRAQWMIIRIEFEYWNLRAKYSPPKPFVEEAPEPPSRADPAPEPEPETETEKQLLLFY